VSGLPEINHATYKAIKHYNRSQLAQFCTNLYKQGYQDGETGSTGIDSEAVFDVIARVRGIGPKRLSAIRSAVESAFAGEARHGAQ
jgi:hypothetical protein